MATVVADDLVGYLSSKLVQTYRAAGAEVTAHCWFCPDGNPKGRGKLYLNTDSWLWECKRCQNKGNKVTLLRHFGDEEERVDNGPESTPGARMLILNEAAEFCADALLDNEEILQYLQDRGLTLETIVDRKLGYIPAGWSLIRSLPTKHKMIDLQATGLATRGGQDFLQGMITIPYITHGQVVQLRGKAKEGKYLTPGGDNARLYGVDDLLGAEIAFVTEGEFDKLVVEQELRKSTEFKDVAVVGLPGAGSLPDRVEDYFSQVKKVYLGFDPDDAGDKGREALAEKIGSTRVRMIELPRDLPKCDWTEYLRPKTPMHPHGGHSFHHVVGLMRDADSKGKRLWTMQDAHHAWSRIDSTVGGVKFGYSELDAYVKPGMKPGQLIVPLAKTGTGKTLWCCNVAYNNRDRPVLYISLEMTRAEVYERLARIARFWQPGLSREDIAAAMPNLRIVDQNRLKEGSVRELCDEFSEDVGMGPQLVVVDYLGYFAKGVRGVGQYEKTGNAVMSLKEDAKSCEVPILAPHQVNRGAEIGKPISSDDARDSGAVEETADILLALFRPSEAVQDGNRIDSNLRAQVLKNRNGTKGQAATVMMSAASWAIVDRLDTAAVRKVDDENYKTHRGMTYEEIYAAQVAEVHKANQGVLA